ncbi:MAG TPA: thiol peroxidase [Gemmataceae bacterium]|jgi:thiol peroxidase|nr:thiol peroxidase [Gemmataceae bacterium]
MQKRPNAVTFKGKGFTLIGPQLKPGDKAPDFTCVNANLELVSLANTPARPRLFLSVPSLDTPVCSAETKKFEEALAGYKDRLACYVVSLDLPFAQKRFCTSENITNVQSLSDVHNHSFGQNWGVLIEGLPLPLLSRAVFVVDKDGTITYAEYVPDVPQHPDYDKALAAIKTVVGA